MNVGGRQPMDQPNELKVVSQKVVNNRRLKLAISAFSVEFAALEYSWGWVIAVLAKNVTIVERLHSLMDFQERLNLIQRLADEQKLPEKLFAQLTTARIRSSKLIGHRDKLRESRSCTLPEVEHYTSEALEMQGVMQRLNDRLLEYAREQQP